MRIPAGVCRGYVPWRANPQPPAGCRGHRGRKQKTTKNSISILLTLLAGISRFLTGRFREDLSEGLWNYVSANSATLSEGEFEAGSAAGSEAPTSHRARVRGQSGIEGMW